MLDYIEKLRKKPERERRKLVLAVSVVIVAVIFAAWSVSVVVKIKSGGLSLIEDGAGKAEVRERLASVREAWARFMDQAGSAFRQASTTASGQ